MFPTTRAPGKNLRPRAITSDARRRAADVRASEAARAPIEANALDNTPTMKALDCDLVFEERHPAYGLVPVNIPKDAC